MTLIDLSRPVFLKRWGGHASLKSINKFPGGREPLRPIQHINFDQ